MVMDRRSARLSMFFKKQDIFFPYRQWPGWAREYILLEHKSNRIRFNLFFFLVGNGLNPEIAAKWITYKDYIVQHPVVGVYNRNALTQLFIQLPKQVKEGTLFRKRKRMYDIAMGRVELM